MYPIFTIFFIFAIFTYIYMNKSNSSFSKEKEALFEREREANSVRKQDISNLPYINLDISSLPEVNSDDEYIKERLSTLNILSSEDNKIINLSEYTNTDLKLKYGVANLTILTEYDQNFTNLCRCLYELGKRLYESGDTDNAKAFLEYGIECGTDLKLHYSLLADIYEQNNQYDCISSLLEKAMNVNSALKQALIDDLSKRLENKL